MKKKLYILLGILGLVLVGFFGAMLIHKSKQKPKLEAENAAVTQSDQRAPTDRLIRADSWSLGPSVARVTVVEFLDPECESCRVMFPVTKKLLSEYPESVRLIVRYMPFHGNSAYAAAALEAAGAQGKYGQALSLLFEKQPEWGSHHNPRPELIPEYMKTLGLDMARFEKDMKNPAFQQKIERDKEDGVALGVTGTPTFFVNGRRLPSLGYEPLKQMIESELGDKSKSALTSR